eukprot:3496007-Pleurochrysis_carterae.AAC.2
MPALNRAQRNTSTSAWTLLLAISAALAAFAAGQSHMPEGSGGLQLPGVGIDAALEIFRRSTDYTDEARRGMLWAEKFATEYQ